MDGLYDGLGLGLRLGLVEAKVAVPSVVYFNTPSVSIFQSLESKMAKEMVASAIL